MDSELKNIKMLRKRLSLTQQELADAAQVSQSLIAKVEAGIVDPSYTAGKQILDTLHTYQQQKEAVAKELMQQHIFSAKPDDQLRKAIAKMEQKAISQLPVLSDGIVVGVLSEKSILRQLGKIDQASALVRDVMEEAPPLIPPETPRRVLVELLTHYNLVIVMTQGKVRGIITKADLLRTV